MSERKHCVTVEAFENEFIFEAVKMFEVLIFKKKHVTHHKHKFML